MNWFVKPEEQPNKRRKCSLIAVVFKLFTGLNYWLTVPEQGP